MPHKRSAESRKRRNMRAVEYQLDREQRRQRRDPRNVGNDPNQLSRMAAGEIAAANYTVDSHSRIKDTRDGVLVKGRNPKHASDRELLGSTVVPDDLTVTVDVWDAETDGRKTITVAASMRDVAVPKSPATTAARSATEVYTRSAW